MIKPRNTITETYWSDRLGFMVDSLGFDFPDRAAATSAPKINPTIDEIAAKFAFDSYEEIAACSDLSKSHMLISVEALTLGFLARLSIINPTVKGVAINPTPIKAKYSRTFFIMAPITIKHQTRNIITRSMR